MAIFRNQPYRTKRFLVDLGDGQDREFSEVILPEARIDVVEYREGGEKTGFGHKLVGRADLGHSSCAGGTRVRSTCISGFRYP